jgi:CRP-like cAMP-binding protein
VSIAISEPVVNRLIAGLPRTARSRLLKRCEPVDMTFGQVLCEPDKPQRHVYFPLTGFISQVAPLDGHPPLEMALIGSEGMLGVTLVLGVGAAPLKGVVQGSGTALRMTASQLLQELHACPALLRKLKRYMYVIITQLAQTTTCTRFHEVEPRLARWLLMTHDRAHADHFHLTHKYLAEMLGVQRSAVTISAGSLQHRKLIGYTRGEISILDRKGLESASCECYDADIKDYAQLLG